MQLGGRDSADERIEHYLSKTFKKTASLFANCCKAVALLAREAKEETEALQRLAYNYGNHLGMAFQLVDDLLDFVARSTTVGKPVVADLKLGLATAPVLFAIREHPDLEPLVLRRFSEPGDVERALDMVRNSEGLLQTKLLAEMHCKEAVRLAKELPDSEYSNCLVEAALTQIHRDK